MQAAVFLTYAHDVELYINQLAYSMSWGSPLLNLAGHRGGGDSPPGFERLDCLWRSVSSVGSWRDSFCDIAPSDLVGLPSHFWSQMIMCITALKYLSVLADPDWDCHAVRNTVNLVAALDRMHERLELGSRDAALPSGDGLLSLLLKLLGKCRAWADVWMNAPSRVPVPEGGLGTHGEGGAGGPHGSTMPDLDQMVIMHTMNLESDQWLEDLLGRSGNYT